MKSPNKFDSAKAYQVGLAGSDNMGGASGMYGIQQCVVSTSPLSLGLGPEISGRIGLFQIQSQPFNPPFAFIASFEQLPFATAANPLTGLWPSFWAAAATGAGFWPCTGEVDILEWILDGKNAGPFGGGGSGASGIACNFTCGRDNSPANVTFPCRIDGDSDWDVVAGGCISQTGLNQPQTCSVPNWNTAAQFIVQRFKASQGTEAVTECPKSCLGAWGLTVEVSAEDSGIVECKVFKIPYEESAQAGKDIEASNALTYLRKKTPGLTWQTPARVKGNPSKGVPNSADSAGALYGSNFCAMFSNQMCHEKGGDKTCTPTLQAGEMPDNGLWKINWMALTGGASQTYYDFTIPNVPKTPPAQFAVTRTWDPAS
jgi:hypothetical protein